MVNGFANSNDEDHQAQSRCLLGYKEYETMLEERRYQNKGRSFENL